MCQRVERHREKGRQGRKEVRVLIKRTPLCFSWEYKLSLYERLHMCKENEMNKQVPEGIRQSRGVNSSSMTMVHQKSALNQFSHCGETGIRCVKEKLLLLLTHDTTVVVSSGKVAEKRLKKNNE